MAAGRAVLFALGLLGEVGALRAPNSAGNALAKMSAENLMVQRFWEKFAEVQLGRVAGNDQGSVDIELIITGDRAPDIDIPFPSGCKLKKKGKDRMAKCHLSGEVNFDITKFRAFEEMFQEGDRLIMESTQGITGVPAALAMMVPSTMPTTKIDCAICGGQCDMRLRTINPDMYKWYNEVVPAWEKMMKSMNKPFKEPSEAEVKAAVKQLPPCPWKSNSSSMFPPEFVLPGTAIAGAQESSQQDTEVYKSMGTTILGMMPDTSMEAVSRLAWVRKNGKTLLELRAKTFTRPK